MSHALLAIGFRPFYPAAALLALVAVPVWMAAFLGALPLNTPLPPLAWHAHEMVFGFAPAVIVGFLLTAVRNWTGHHTPDGAALAGLVLLCLTARVLLVTGPAPVAVLVDVIFLPVVAAALAVPLWRGRNARNAFVVPLLLALGCLSAAHHGAYSGWLDGTWATRAVTAGLDLVALLMAVIGGRVIPAFSANAVPGLAPRRWSAVEASSLGLLALIVVLDLSPLAAAVPQPLLHGVFAAAGGIHLLRLAGWRPWETRRNALLLALPLAYLWLPVHLLLRTWLDTTPGQMAPLALHALTVGGMAGLMLAMMTRSALGHTGRALTAGPWEYAAFAGIHLAGLTRVLGPLLWPQAYTAWLVISALCWSFAFAAFAARYVPVVARPRVDAAA
ncbi:MAG: NnrS family protein [Pseudomonadota bacterium]